MRLRMRMRARVLCTSECTVCPHRMHATTACTRAPHSHHGALACILPLAPARSPLARSPSLARTLAKLACAAAAFQAALDVASKTRTSRKIGWRGGGSGGDALVPRKRTSQRNIKLKINGNSTETQRKLMQTGNSRAHVPTLVIVTI